MTRAAMVAPVAAPCHGVAGRRADAKGWVFHRTAGMNCPYQARLKVNGRRLSLGYYMTPEEAAAAYRGACRLLAAAGSPLDRGQSTPAAAPAPDV